MNLSKSDLQKLKKLRELMTLERFGTSGNVAKLDGNGKAYKTISTTELVREETKLFRDTYVLPVLDELIAKHGGEPKAPEADLRKALWIFDWGGDGYNQVQAVTREEALAEAKKKCPSLFPTLTNLKKLSEAQEKEYWKTFEVGGSRWTD